MVLGCWSRTMREFRHSPCLMTPVTSLMVLLMSILGLATLVLQFPTFVLGLFMAPLVSRSQWLVEFLYPSAIARWGHILLLRWGASGKNGVKLNDSDSSSMNMHSRAIELRTEVVKGRVYIHPLPQLLDNVGYLIVCIPPRGRSNTPAPILGILVDCGDADSVVDQLDLIRDVHYSNVRNNTIEVRALLCTHKHHDHTAGNKGLINHAVVGSTLKDIYGGAIEKVPYCTRTVKNGDFINLPQAGNNDMSKLIEIECVAVPSHTRGSVVYALRNKPPEDFGCSSQDVPVFSYLFTGDAMFSGGGGVPFEADLEFPKDSAVDGKTVHSNFKPGAGALSIERCFAEILRRAVKDEDCGYSPDGLGVEQMIVYPGHEYTLELMQRQFQTSNLNAMNQWNRHQPSVFFELCSAFFIAGHRRSLPKSTRLLTVPSTIKKELKINIHFRSLRKRGDQVLTAVSIWYKHLYDQQRQNKDVNGENTTYLSMPSTFSNDRSINHSLSVMTNGTDKSPSSENTWNVNHADLNRPIFTTVYTNDLENIVNGLKSGKMSSTNAAIKLSKLSEKLDSPTVVRRPIPNTLPSEKKMYLGLLAIAALGSPPSATSVYDSDMMNLPAPVKKSDNLLISKKLLISTLFRLGLMPDNSSQGGAHDLVRMINLLWEDARMDRGHDLKLDEENGDLFQLGSDENDLIELGALKLTLFAVSYNQPSWFSKYCMPCKSTPKGESVSKIRRSGGDLVKHDTGKCPMCANALGCPKDSCLNHTDSDDDDLSYDSQPTTPTNEIHLVNTSPNKNADGGSIELRVARGVPKRKLVIDKERPS